MKIEALLQCAVTWKFIMTEKITKMRSNLNFPITWFLLDLEELRYSVHMQMFMNFYIPVNFLLSRGTFRCTLTELLE